MHYASSRQHYPSVCCVNDVDDDYLQTDGLLMTAPAAAAAAALNARLASHIASDGIANETTAALITWHRL